jgi:hypothetical protein
MSILKPIKIPVATRSSWSLVQKSPTECGVSNVCDRETSKNDEA